MSSNLTLMILFFIVLSRCLILSFDNFALADLTKKESTIIVNGKRSNHKELRNIPPSKIKEVNFITASEKLSRNGKNSDGIIEVNLFEATKTDTEVPDTSQVRINGMKITDFENQPTPLLVFDKGIIIDQNPNNIDTRQMEWIDFHLNDSETCKQGEKAINGLIEAQIKTPEIFVNYEVMPEFPGGESALRELISRNIKYPKEVLKDSLQGKVYVTFTITKTGKVENSQITRGIHPALDKESIRVVSLFPDWIPGEQYYPGKFGPVICETRFTIPIDFRLSDVNSGR